MPFRATAHSGTDYPITQEELEVLQDVQLRPGRKGWRPYPRQGFHVEEAASEFVRGIKDGSNYHRWTQEEWEGARNRLREFLDREGNGESWTWHPDIIFKIFNDLDICFFNMELCRRVHLRWTSRPTRPDALAVTEPPSRSCRRVQITLYYELICESDPPLYLVVGCLVHEMLHAYLLIMTLGNDHEYNINGKPSYHGPSFVRCAKVLDKVYKGRLDMLDGLKEEKGHCPGWKLPGKAWHPGAMFGGTLYPEDFYHPGEMYSGGTWEGLMYPY